MALLLTHSHRLSYPRHHFSLPGEHRSIISSQPANLELVRHPSVFRCSAVTLDNGGFEDSRDGGFVAANESPPRVTNSGAADRNHATQVPAMATSSDSAPVVGEVTPAQEEPAWIPRVEGMVERVWLQVLL